MIAEQSTPLLHVRYDDGITTSNNRDSNVMLMTAMQQHKAAAQVRKMQAGSRQALNNTQENVNKNGSI